MKLNELLRLFLLPVFKPIGGIHELLENRRRIEYSVLVYLFLGTIYTISVQLAYSRGIGAMVEPFLKIPASEYYRLQRFYQIPFFFIVSILFAGTGRLLSIPVKGRGRFEDIFCIFCIAQTLPMFLTMWVPETIGFIFFPGQAIYPLSIDIARQVAGIVWPLIIMIIGISITERIRWYYSMIITLIAAIPAVGLMVIFIR